MSSAPPETGGGEPVTDLNPIPAVNMEPQQQQPQQQQRPPSALAVGTDVPSSSAAINRGVSKMSLQKGNPNGAETSTIRGSLIGEEVGAAIVAELLKDVSTGANVGVGNMEGGVGAGETLMENKVAYPGPSGPSESRDVAVKSDNDFQFSDDESTRYKYISKKKKASQALEAIKSQDGFETSDEGRNKPSIRANYHIRKPKRNANTGSGASLQTYNPSEPSNPSLNDDGGGEPRYQHKRSDTTASQTLFSSKNNPVSDDDHSPYGTDTEDQKTRHNAGKNVSKPVPFNDYYKQKQPQPTIVEEQQRYSNYNNTTYGANFIPLYDDEFPGKRTEVRKPDPISITIEQPHKTSVAGSVTRPMSNQSYKSKKSYNKRAKKSNSPVVDTEIPEEEDSSSNLEEENQQLRLQIASLKQALKDGGSPMGLMPRVISRVPASVEANMNLKYQFQQRLAVEREKYSLLLDNNKELQARVKDLETNLSKRLHGPEAKHSKANNEVQYWKKKYKELTNEKRKVEEKLHQIALQLEKTDTERIKLIKEIDTVHTHYSQFSDLGPVIDSPASPRKLKSPTAKSPVKKKEKKKHVEIWQSEWPGSVPPVHESELTKENAPVNIANVVTKKPARSNSFSTIMERDLPTANPPPKAASNATIHPIRGAYRESLSSIYPGNPKGKTGWKSGADDDAASVIFTPSSSKRSNPNLHKKEEDMDDYMKALKLQAEYNVYVSRQKRESNIEV
ncbi:hypothetical protein HDV05_006115 [Chytridiales sp. JEL 0842]|nr:hypothetical protein HDV05_006115 [Chytridiales sp. JEL 0842]